MTSPGEVEFSHEIDLTTLSRGGKEIHLCANEEERAKIATRLGVIAVRLLRGDLTITASKMDIEITGSLNAQLTRECVASLEEMTEDINEVFEVEFLRQAADSASASFAFSEDESWDGEEVPPEVHEDDLFDLGEFLVQQLALAMDPFPRKPGAKRLTETYGGGGDVSPFAALKEKLKKNNENQ